MAHIYTNRKITLESSMLYHDICFVYFLFFDGMIIPRLSYKVNDLDCIEESWIMHIFSFVSLVSMLFSNQMVLVLFFSMFTSSIFLTADVLAQSLTLNYYTKWGSLGEGDGQFDGQNDVDYNNGKVYVADYANHRIQIFDPEGNFITKFGDGGEGDGQFHKASAMSMDSQGNIYVADQFNFRIQKFTNDGQFIGKWGSKGTGDGQFQGPSGLSIDANDNIYVTDKNNDRIQVFTSDGQSIARFGETGAGDGQLSKPEGVGVDKDTGTVYVADTGNSRIQVFKPI
jgi:DNA-binding beta-propeller fold protein YncE